MCSQLHMILVFLKRSGSAHSIKQIDQILAKAIRNGLIHTTPTWNCILRAYSNSPTPTKAILIYNHYIKSIHPDNYTFPAILKACSRLSSLPKGKEAHAHITKVGLDNDMYSQNALIHFYGSTAQTTDARHLFDNMPQRDVTSWNTLLATYNNNPSSHIEALALFQNMLCEGIRADEITLVILLANCAQGRRIGYGRAVHANAIKGGFACNLNLENALQSLVDLARDIFDQMVDKDFVCWNSMIHAYVKAKRPEEALELFNKMGTEEVKPDETTIVSVLAACASLSDLQYGRQVHQFILRNNIRQDLFVGTALIDMYSKCGSLEEAMVTFYKMEYKDVFTWTTVIEGLANSGYTNEALRLFNQMEENGIKPNEATFVSVLAACRQSGMVDEGCFLFRRMVGFYSTQPKIEHFGCVIDLLSRAGLLNQAEEFIQIMRPGERLIAYKTLLSACMSYSKIDLGLEVADKLIQLDSQNHAVYTLLSNFYALAGQWTKVIEIRRIMKEFDMTKQPGISLIEVKT
ncbi:hypothetical protein F0562_017990 [Nyssa sinensis]|uniref:Pentacotripeptide-repeat region of PRORP domain-containing protein n=1 Tax=Nyssa sinensis TaxID=561372 RepID=A0A5J4ZC37_9ASTE|nr:hypothetical protein F0562_017990 [Nyssa sinensis]